MTEPRETVEQVMDRLAVPSWVRQPLLDGLRDAEPAAPPTALVARLCAVRRTLDEFAPARDGMGTPVQDALTEAADALERLAADLAAARAEVRARQVDLVKAGVRIAGLMAEAHALRRQVAAVRAKVGAIQASTDGLLSALNRGTLNRSDGHLRADYDYLATALADVLAALDTEEPA